MKTLDESGKPAELTIPQIKAATMLAGGMRGKDVAAKLKLTEECISRWRKHPRFVARTNQLTQDSIDAVKLGLNDLATRAISSLGDLLESKNETTRLKAIQLVLATQAATPSSGRLETDPEAIALDQKNTKNMNAILAKMAV